MNQSDLLDRITQLEAEAARRRSHSSRWRRTTALGAVLGAVAVGLVASAGAAPTTDTTAVSFVSIPAKKVMSANSIPAGATESATVIGGTTTVPSNATTVRLDVTVKGTAAGTITLFPAGNEAGGAGHTVSWAANATVTETEAENVGLGNKVSVKNTSTKAAVVTLTITGYSTQVTAGDINGSGGTDGQVLTNNGAGGARWATPASVDTAKPGDLESGPWGVGGPGRYLVTQISFPRKIVGTMATQYLGYAQPVTAQCPGPGQAAPGYLCVYTSWSYQTQYYAIINPANQGNGFVGPNGTTLYLTATDPQSNARGTWTARAPLSTTGSSSARQRQENHYKPGVTGP